MSSQPPASDSLAFFASVGRTILRYRLDVASGAFTFEGRAADLPANVQYAWPHVSGRFLYVASSDGAPGLGIVGERHHLSAFAIDPATGALSLHGEPVPLPARPIHMTCDAPSRHALIAFSDPPALRVYAIAEDGRLRGEVEQRAPIDPGIFPHQVRVTADNHLVILVSRGHDAKPDRPERPGVLSVFTYGNGQLTGQQRIAPNGGYGFGPRHLDFHPEHGWVYVALERQHRLDVFARVGDAVSSEMLFSRSTLESEDSLYQHPGPGPIHVHPNGRYVYVANRAPEILGDGHLPSYAGGGNVIVVYAIDAASGEPRPIQHVDSGGIHCRTFQIDPGGTLLVAAHIVGLNIDGDPARFVPAGLSFFRIGEDGCLTQFKFHEIATGGHQLFWTGMVPLSGGDGRE
jgi:6-phosphogluconolactonase (cycloisomerase 2 family)